MEFDDLWGCNLGDNSIVLRAIITTIKITWFTTLNGLVKLIFVQADYFLNESSDFKLL